MLRQYVNGNYTVQMYSDGTKIRLIPDNQNPMPQFAQSMDIKITNWCDNPICQKWCHEQSNQSGKHGCVQTILNSHRNVTPGIQRALGGGSTLSHPQIYPLLKGLKKLGIFTNVTVNQYHIDSQLQMLKKFTSQDIVKGVGISLTSRKTQNITRAFNQLDNVVLHVIAGVHSVEETLQALKGSKNPKVLILGYKDFGNGKLFKMARPKAVNDRIMDWYRNIFTLCKQQNLIVSFDNLSISQLNIKRLLTQQQWDMFYQGQEGTHTFYMDAVKKQFASHSTAQKRYPIEEGMTVEQMFKIVLAEKVNLVVA